MKVRNTTGRGVLVPGQKVVRPGPDSVAVKDSEDVRALIAAGVFEVDEDAASSGSSSPGRKASNNASEESA
jgi:hypothetical protein